jgi:Domain of unknown function (DUF892)
MSKDGTKSPDANRVVCASLEGVLARRWLRTKSNETGWNITKWPDGALAQRLGKDEPANILQETLNEECEAGHKLTSIAERHVNIAAAQV